MKQRFATGNQSFYDSARASSYGGLFILLLPIFLIIFIVQLIGRAFKGKKTPSQNSIFNPEDTDYLVKIQYLKENNWIELSPMTFQKNGIELIFASTDTLEVYRQITTERLGDYHIKTLKDLIDSISNHSL